jgi:hypothetical protein
MASTQCRIIGWFTGSSASTGGPVDCPSKADKPSTGD